MSQELITAAKYKARRIMIRPMANTVLQVMALVAMVVAANWNGETNGSLIVLAFLTLIWEWRD